jgi:beta-lactamase regulating signal transducer with metallopeptidase domain
MTTLIDFLNRSGDMFVATVGPLVAQSSVLILLLLLLQPLLRRRARASVRYAVWMLVPLKLLLPPSLALPTSMAYWIVPAETIAPLAQASTATPPTINGAAPQRIRSAPIAPRPTTPPLSPSAVIFIIWVSGTICLAGWIVRGHFASRRLVRASSPAPPELEELLDDCRRDLGVRAGIAVRCSDSASTPALCGLTSPTVVIPASIAGLEADMVRPVLLHELAHYKRGDLWMNQLLVLGQLLHWFNPLTWVAASVIRRTREEAVDDVVVEQMRGEEDTYASTLIHIARSVVARRAASTAGMVGIMESGTLRGRIERVLSARSPRRTRIGWPAALAVVCFACVVLPMASGQTVVAQAPASAIADGGPSLLEPLLILIPGYEEMRKRQWLDRVAANPNDVRLLQQAADFMMVIDQAQARTFLERASTLEPDNVQVVASLAQVHSLRAQVSGRGEDARHALEYAEKEQRLKPGVSATYLKVAQLAFDAGEFSKASKYASEYLETAKADTRHWANGDLVHKGNLVLGRIAVREKRLDDAERYLRASADTSGSPVLKSFGPNMSLAKDLLDAGRSAAVLEYFDACGEFWTLDFFRLRRWTSAVRAGQVPDFGPNLVY